LAIGPSQADSDAPQVLVTVGDQSVTSSDLETAIASSPFLVQFNTMGKDDQAALRGSLLRRLVAARLLFLEARRLGLEDSEAYRSERESFRQGLLYRSYVDTLRAGIVVPDDVKAEMKREFAGNSGARKAAESAYRARRFRDVTVEDLRRLRRLYKVQVHEDAIRSDALDDAVLLDGDGIKITYGDIKSGTNGAKDNAEWMHDRLYERAQFLLAVRAAGEQTPNLTRALAHYRNERLPAMLLERKEREWIPGDKVLEDYFKDHPELGRIVELRHIGQIVLATREEAETMRRRILAGESLFALAGEHSIDPVGRAHRGDMGWIKADRGHRAINEAIASLQDNEISEVVQTPVGFHIVTILERRPGEQRPFERVKDKVRQQFLEERLQAYVDRLERRYQVAWHLIDREAEASAN